MRGALDDAGLAPSAVDLWLASRDGVVEMDRAEAEAARRVFGDPPPRSLSVKDAIGRARTVRRQFGSTSDLRHGQVARDLPRVRLAPLAEEAVLQADEGCDFDFMIPRRMG